MKHLWLLALIPAVAIAGGYDKTGSGSWSQESAVSDVNMAGYSITNATSVYVGSTNLLTQIDAAETHVLSVSNDLDVVETNYVVNTGDTMAGNYDVTGTLGIGTNTPSATLDVHGHVEIGDGSNLLFSTSGQTVDSQCYIGPVFDSSGRVTNFKFSVYSDYHSAYTNVILDFD